MIELKKIQYNGFKDALEITNNIVRLVVAVDAGPRVLFYGFVNGQNFFHNFAHETGPIDDNKWHSYGGHRLWYAPETAQRTYYPDNVPVAWSWENNRLILDCPDETSRWIGKKIVIALEENSSRVTIEHTLSNIGLWPLEVSIWCISVMAAGGRLKVPQADYVPHGGGPGETFQPARSVTLWPFTRMDDQRIGWGRDFLTIQQDDAAAGKLKIGMLNEKGYVLYELNNETFRKEFDCIPGKVYPDMNCNCEFYTEPGFLEIESLSPMTRLAEGEAFSHTECWSLSR